MANSIQVPEALVKVGERFGVEYRLNTDISRIQLSDDGKRATGVVLSETQETLEADIVICNADLVYAYTNLLPPTSYSRSLAKREASCSSISFYWALDRQFPELSAHNIFLAKEYRESFDNIFKRHLIPDEPSFYVNVPSRADPSAAPEGCDAIVVLVPVGHLLDSATETHKGSPNSKGTSQNWDAMVATARETILKTIEARLQISLSSHIISESINTPPSWKTAFNLDRGAILGLSHSFFNVLSFRPKTTHPNISQLYFVGASTHPGTGVPIVLAGAKIVAEQVLGDMSLPFPWKGNGEKRITEGEGEEAGSQLDKARWLPMYEGFHWAVALIAGLFIYLCSILLGQGGLDWTKGSGRFVGDW
jgi:phytoene desaturase (3,4-didehydrolycopene-forming)